MPKIITLGGQKGGTGKSTIAINLAAEWKRRGFRVLLVDTDPQGSALEWSEVAAEGGYDAPRVIAVGDNVRQTVPGLADAHDFTVIDTAGRVSRRLVSSLAIADLALLPCNPGTTDVWAIGKSLDKVEEVQEAVAGSGRELHARVVLNQQQTRTALSKGVRGALQEAGAIVLNSELGDRVAFGEAPASGQGVTSYATGSAASAELMALTDELETVLGLRPVEQRQESRA